MSANSPSVASVRLPGRWRDAWLYREHLLLWQRDNSMLTVPLERVAKQVARASDEPTAVALEYLLMRNDWKNSEHFRKLLRVPGVGEGVHEAVRSAGGGVEISTDDVGLVAAEVEPAAGVLLDSHLYANRIYLASTEGLFESRFRSRPGFESDQVQLMSRRVADVSARYACLTASAEDEGLWFRSIPFEDDPYAPLPPFEQVADFSLGTSYASRHLLNYVDAAVPQFLRAEAHRARLTERAEYEEWQVTGYEPPRDITQAAVLALRTRTQVELALAHHAATDESSGEASSIEVLGNSNFRLLVGWHGRLRVLDISAYENKDIALRPDRRFAATESLQITTESVLETYAIGAGFLIETLDEVRLITESGSYPFFRGPAARVRTFTSSRRHQDVAVIVGEDAVHIVGFL